MTKNHTQGCRVRKAAEIACALVFLAITALTLATVAGWTTVHDAALTTLTILYGSLSLIAWSGGREHRTMAFALTAMTLGFLGLLIWT